MAGCINIPNPDYLPPRPWNGAPLAEACDGQWAQANPGNVGHETNWLQCTTASNLYGVPAGSVIVGITVQNKISASVNPFGVGTDNTSSDLHQRIVKGAVMGTEERADTGNFYPSPRSAQAFRSHGGQNDLWGETWTADDINSGSFGAMVASINTASSSWIDIDCVQIEVCWLPANTPTPSPTATRSPGARSRLQWW